MANKKDKQNLFDYEQSKKSARVFLDPSSSEEISQEDFKFVQMDKSIHDTKFDTQPTTFFKDALRRFVKNKSSVVAFIILSVIILMAIFVPVFNDNPIDRNFPEQRFLTPRWRGFENASVFNGKRTFRNALVVKPDPDDQSTWYPAGRKKEAVVAGSERYFDDTISGTPSIYATGGSLSIRTDTRERSSGLISYPEQLDFSANSDFQIQMYLPEDKNTYSVGLGGVDVVRESIAEYAVFISVEYEPGEEEIVYLTDFSSQFGEIIIDDVNAKVLANRPDGVSETTFNAKVGYELKTVAEGDFPILFVDKFIFENKLDTTQNLERLSWSDANALLLRPVTRPESIPVAEWRPTNWSIYGSGTRSLDRANVTRVTFEYDEYLDVFGLRKNYVISGTKVTEYINEGWIEYDFNEGVSSFKLTELGEEHSPLRSVSAQIDLPGATGTIYELTGDVVMYRYWGYDNIPYYIFGTNHSGRDQFKVVFSGLRTSLLLGLITTVICVTIGIIWGSISGYYGGWVDLIMERITDILSGVPYIVVMTLSILLLGNNFGVFILSLVLTGWIGISSRTRAQFYRYKGREFVLASRTLGAKDSRLIFKHILPNAIGPIITGSILMIPSIVFTEANIAYLGLGLQGMPSLGVALSEAQKYLASDPYLIVSSAIVVSILMICFNLFGNGLRDAFNPSLKGAE
ncbi:MAG: ABC transporter permease subunit [Erysipelotrichaceae bacterium]|nr:ABC transporter permease subunit [Erysipelotrichaceae bacterium]